MSATITEFPTHGELKNGAPGRFYARVRSLGHGQTEVCLKPFSERRYDDYGIPMRRASAPTDAESNRQRSARRAKSQVRMKCKVAAVNSLWTLTYRANETNREQVVRDFDQFCRRVRRVLPDLGYVATLERQKRGAFHIHMATHRTPSLIATNGVKVKSWNVLRAIWRSVTGERGGNFDEVKAKGRTHRARSHKIASYIAKYVSKAFEEGERHDRRYWCSKGIIIPEAEILAIKAETFAEAIALVHTMYGSVGENFFGSMKPCPRTGLLTNPLRINKCMNITAPGEPYSGPAVSYLLAADELCRLYEMESGPFSSSWEPELPILHLYSMAIELQLKTFLVLSGVSVDEVSRFRHRLRDLYSACQQAGMDLGHKASHFGAVLNWIADGHENHQHRYFERSLMTGHPSSVRKAAHFLRPVVGQKYHEAMARLEANAPPGSIVTTGKLFAMVELAESSPDAGREGVDSERQDR